MRRKVYSHEKDNNVEKQADEAKSTVQRHQVIKPIPRALTKTAPRLQGKLFNSSKVGVSEAAGAASSGSGNWWETLLENKKDNHEGNIINNTCFFGGADGELDLWDEELNPIACDFLSEGENWSDFLLDL